MFNNRDYEAVEIIMNYCFGKIFLMLNIPNNRAYLIISDNFLSFIFKNFEEPLFLFVMYEF